MRYSIEPTDRIFVKGYGFLSYAKNMNKNIDKNISKNLSDKYSQKCLDHAKQLLQIHLKLTQIKQSKKQQKQLVIWLAIKLLPKLRKSQEVQYRIVQRQLQMKQK